MTGSSHTDTRNSHGMAVRTASMDIVADGAAALYGNEAVAGVVNFVPYKSYDGFKVDTYAEQSADGDYDQHNVQMMWGGEIGDLDVVLAGAFSANSRLGWDERSVLANSGLTISSNAPGNWFVPPRGADGLYTGGSNVRTPDPSCRPGSERTGYEPDVIANEVGNLLGPDTPLSMPTRSLILRYCNGNM